MNVRVYATLRPIVGGPVAQLQTDTGDTFRQMLDELLTRWPRLWHWRGWPPLAAIA